MNKYLFVCILVLFPFLNCALADLKVEGWKQQNTFTKYGQLIEVIVKLRTTELETNYYHDYWGYIFGDGGNIEVVEAQVVNSSNYKSTFGDNTLKIYFDKLFNNKTITLYFKYNYINLKVL